MKIVRLHIESYEDRRELCAILADNGYKVRVADDDKSLPVWDREQFVEIEVEE